MFRKLATAFQSSIQIKLLLTYLLIIAIPLTTIAGVLYFSLSSISEKQTEENRSLLMKTMSFTLEEYLHQIELFSQSIYLNEVQQLLNRDPVDLFEKVRIEAEIFDQMQQWLGLMNLNFQIDNLTIIRSNGEVLRAHGDYQQEQYEAIEPWYNKAMEKQGALVIYGPTFQSMRSNTQSDPIFSVARKINNTLNHKNLGVLFVDIKIVDIYRVLSEYHATLEDKDLFILNGEDKIIFSKDLTQVGDSFNASFVNESHLSGWGQYKNTRTFYNQYFSSLTNWRIITLDSEANMKYYSVQVRNMVTVIGGITIVIAFLISIFVAGKFTKPLRMLKNQMKDVQTGNFKRPTIPASKDEIGQLTISFANMTTQIDRLVNDVYKAEINRKEAELRALHSQINPHFLYNTLDSMNALALIEDVPELSTMANLLAGMFRYSTSNTNTEVPLFKEIEQIKRYMQIQNFRYDDKFKLVLTIDPAVLSYPILKLSIQPIVENAIYHGLEMKDELGEIVLSSEENADAVFIHVSDNGVGMSQEKLHAIRNTLLIDNANSDHIGLKNVHDRIKLHYGEDFGLHIESEEQKGTTITFKLPIPSSRV